VYFDAQGNWYFRDYAALKLTVKTRDEVLSKGAKVDADEVGSHTITPVSDAIEALNSIETVEALQEFTAKDTRKGVIKAVEDRIAIMTAGAEEAAKEAAEAAEAAAKEAAEDGK
jgi:hypothetical protein